MLPLILAASLVLPTYPDPAKLAEHIRQQEWLAKQSPEPRTPETFSRRERFAIPPQNRNPAAAQ